LKSVEEAKAREKTRKAIIRGIWIFVIIVLIIAATAIYIQKKNQYYEKQVDTGGDPEK